MNKRFAVFLSLAFTSLLTACGGSDPASTAATEQTSTAITAAETTVVTTPDTSGATQAAPPTADQPTTTNADLASTTAVSDRLALQILQGPPFAPKDATMFSPQTYNTPPTPPAPPKPTSEYQLRAELATALALRFGTNDPRTREGVAVFDDPVIKSYVSDPRLRVALALLKGTAAEVAIQSIRNGDFARVIFGDLSRSNAIGVSQLVTGDTKQTIVINERYQYENPKLLAEVMAHEVLHPDNVGSNKEELVANTIECLIYGKLVLEDGTIARSQTELARRLNTKLMALINSRDAEGRIRILTSSTDNVYPGSSVTRPYFAAAFLPFGADTPGNTVLRVMLANVTGRDSSNAHFDDPTIRLLDRNINLLTPSEWVQLANILKLDTGL